MIPNIMLAEIRDGFLAVPAFIPITVCTGYLAGWFSDLHGFRRRSFIERIFWSIPLSVSISPIAAYLIGRFLQLNSVIAFFWLSAGLFLVVVSREWLEARKSGRKIVFGWRPFGAVALSLAIAWMVFAILALADFQSGEQLFAPLQYWDLGARVAWTQGILHTGIPPANPLYLYQHPAPMRNYYFWYIVCAVVSRAFQLPVRAALTGSCIWAGFALAALIGLYLKHFLGVGSRLRKQFIIAVCLLSVTGLDVSVLLWRLCVLHVRLPMDPLFWSSDPILGWSYSILWSPHHIIGLACCMSVFLLAHLFGRDDRPRSILTVALIGLALASAFGVSVFVPFSFFLVLSVWAIRQVIFERDNRTPLVLLGGGTLAMILLSPFLWQLLRSTSHMQGGMLLRFGIREFVAPERLLNQSFLHRIAIAHPTASDSLVKLAFLPVGYTIGFGFFLVPLVVCLIPAMRCHSVLTAAQRTSVFLCAVSFPLITFIRSGVLISDDYGFRAPYVMQFLLLLLGSEFILSWQKLGDDTDAVLPQNKTIGPAPKLMRYLAILTISIGFASTLNQAFFYRFDLLLIAIRSHQSADLYAHTPYVLAVGYAKLDAAIPPRSVVQPNPTDIDRFRESTNEMNVSHQTAITVDRPGCGSEVGGDPSGCAEMAFFITSLFKHASADQAQNVCHRYGIQYLVANIYDPVWRDKRSWVWALTPAVADPEFRALDCR